MRLFRWLAGGLFTATALAAAAWFSAPWWLALIARYELESLGYSEVIVEIEAIGHRESRLARLHLRDRRSGLEIEAGNAILSYQPAGLFQKRLDTLSLAALTVSLQASQPQGSGTLLLMSPAALFAQLPVGRLEITRLTLRQLDHRQFLQQKLSGSMHYDEKSAALILHEERGEAGLQAELRLDRQGACRARLAQADREIARIRCQLHEAAERMALIGDLHAELGELETLLTTWTGWPERNLSGELKAAWGVSLPREMTSSRLLEALEADARFDLTATLDAGQPLELSLQGTAAFRDNQGEWSLADGAQVRFGKKLASSLVVEGLSGALTPSEAWRLTVASNGRLRIRNLQSGDLAVARLDLMLTEPLALSLADNAEMVLNQPARFSVGATELRQKKERLHIQATSVELKPGSLLSPAGSIRINGLRYETKTAKLPVAAMAADFSLSGDALHARGTLSAENDQLHLDWRLTQSTKNNSGRMEFSTRPLRFPAAWPLLARIVPVDKPLELRSGSLAGQGNLAWSGSRPLSGNVGVELGGINALYGETAILGLNGRATVTIRGDALHLRSDDLRLAEVNPGLALTNIGVQAAVDLPTKGPIRLLLTGLKAEVLGGQISSERIDIEPGRASNPFLIRLTGIDAGQLAEFRRQEGLSAEGKLDGELPFDWTDKGLKMIAGSLAARAPGGLIRYLGTSSIQQMAESEQTMRMAMQILGDFHFKVLRLKADYQPDGELALHIELKGSNPAYEKGRPIELNLNIEENVLKLLQSLRMADEISGRLEKKVQEKIQKR